MARPFAVIGFAAFAGLLVCFCFPFYAAVTIGCIAILAIVGCLVWRRWRQTTVLFFVSAFLLCLCLGQWYVHAYYRPVMRMQGQSITVEGNLGEQTKSSGGYYAYLAAIRTADEKAQRCNMRIYSSDELSAYSDFQAILEVNPADPYAPIAENEALAGGALLSAFYQPQEGSAIHYLGGINRPGMFFSALRTQVKNAILSTSPHEYGALLLGAVTGDKSAMTVAQEKTVRDSGIAHLFAVSGLHLSLFVNLLMVLLLRLRVGRVIRCALLMGLCVFFMAVIGFTPSVTRAGIMMLLYLGGQLVLRRSDPLNALGLAVLVMLVAEPLNAVNAGFVLSVFSTAGVVAVYPVVHKRLVRKLKPRYRVSAALLDYFSVSLAANLAILPASVLIFPTLSLVGPLTNTLAGFFIPFLVGFGFIAAIFALLGAGGFFLGLFSQIGSFFAWIIYQIATCMTRIPFATVPVRWYVRLCIFGFFAAVVVVCLRRVSLRRIRNVACVALPVLFFAVACDTLLTPHMAQITVFSSATGSVACVRSENRCVVVADRLDRNTVRQLCAYLDAQAVGEIDYWVQTRSDAKTRAALQTAGNRLQIAAISANEEIDGVRASFYPLRDFTLDVSKGFSLRYYNDKGRSMVSFNLPGGPVAWLGDGFDPSVLEDEERTRAYRCVIYSANDPKVPLGAPLSVEGGTEKQTQLWWLGNLPTILQRGNTY